MKNRVIGFILAVSILFSAIAPTTAYAVSSENQKQDVETNQQFEQESTEMFIAAPPINNDGDLLDNNIITYMDGNNVLLVTSVPNNANVTDIPETAKIGKALVGWYKDAQFTEPFYAQEPVTESMNVYARFEDVSSITDTEKYTPSYISIDDAKTDFTFKINVPQGTSLNEIERNVSITASVETQNVKLLFNKVSTANGKDTYSVSSSEGYALSASYQITLIDENYILLNTQDSSEHSATVRQLNLVIESGPEQNKLEYSDAVKFIKSSDISGFIVNGKVVEPESFDAPVLSLNENGEQVELDKQKGEFVYSSANNLTVGDIVSIYKTDDPRLNMNAEASFVKVTGINGSTVEFSTLDETDSSKVFRLPSSVLVFVDESIIDFPTDNGSGKLIVDIDLDDTDVEAGDYILDEELYDIAKAAVDTETQQLISVPSKILANDIVTFVNKKNNTISDEDGKTIFGVVSSAKEKSDGLYEVIIDIKKDEKELQDSLNSFSSQNLPYSTISQSIDETQVIEDVEKQVIESGFIDEATDNMVQQALTSTDFFEQIGLSPDDLYDENGDMRTTDEVLMMAGFAPAPIITPPVIKFDLGESHEKFDDGLRVNLSIELGITIEPGRLDTTRKTLQIDVVTTFTQEIAFGIDASGYLALVPVLIPPPFPLWVILVPAKLDLSVSVEVKTYTNATFNLQMYSLKENAGLAVKQLKTISRAPLGDLKPYAMKIGRIQGYYDMYLLAVEQGKPNALELYDEATKAYAELQKEYPFDPNDPNDPDDIDFSALSFESFIDADITIMQSDDILSAITTERDVSVAKQKTNELINSYSDLIEGSESEWMELVKKGLFGPKGLSYQFFVIDIVFQASLVISADILISLSSEMTYQYGKRYTFWMKWDVINGFESGTNEMDLLDEHFAYSFSIMGYIGLRFGIELSFRVGIISIYLANVGIAGEVGVYAKLYGYFVYAYDRLRRANQTQVEISESAMGALFLDIGWYAEVDLIATLLEGFQSYEMRLFDYEQSLFTAGIQKNVYDFTYSVKDDVRINFVDETLHDDEIKLQLPDILQTMKVVDLKTGELSNELFDASNFNFISSSPYFEVMPDGSVTVTPPNDRIRYMEADIQIIWKGQPLTFSNCPTVTTIPVVWNNLSTEELSNPQTVSVIVVDDNGRTNVWSDMVYASEWFYLPSEEEILDMLNYDSFNITNTDTAEITNLKYDNIKGYTVDSTGLNINQSEGGLVLTDTEFYFELSLRDYSVNINEVQGAVTNETLTAYFGESFDLSPLINSGFDGPDKFSSFMGIETIRPDSHKDLNLGNRDFSKPIDISFAKELLDKETTYSAKYEDTTVDVTYNFQGLTAAPVTKVYEKGSIPNFENDVVAHANTAMGDVKHFIESITPNISAVTADTIYNVKYIINSPDNPTPIYTLTYYTQGIQSGAKIEQSYIENTIAFPISTPEKTGSSFVGWYLDENFINEFTGFSSATPHKMTEDISVYAKFEEQPYKISFEANLVGQQNPESRSIIYGFDYSTADTEPTSGTPGLPVLSDANMSFLGWYTKADNTGIKVEQTDKHQIDSDIILYAHWEEKMTFTVTTNGNQTEEKVDSYTGENNTNKTIFTYAPAVEREIDFIVTVDGPNITTPRPATAEELAMLATSYQWRRVKVDPNGPEPPAADWVTTPPVDGGEYYAKVTFAGDNEYKTLSADFGAGVLTIDPIEVDIDTITNITPLVKGPNIIVTYEPPITAPGVQLQYYYQVVGSFAYDSGWIDSSVYGGFEQESYNIYVRVKPTRNYKATDNDVGDNLTHDQKLLTGPTLTEKAADYWYMSYKIEPRSGELDNYLSTRMQSSQLNSVASGGLLPGDTISAGDAVTWVTEPTQHWNGVKLSNYLNVNIGNNFVGGSNSVIARGIDPWSIDYLDIWMADDGGITSKDEFVAEHTLLVYDNANVLKSQVTVFEGQAVRMDEADNFGSLTAHESFYEILKRNISKVALEVELVSGGIVVPQETEATMTYDSVFVSDQYGVYDAFLLSEAPTVTFSNDVSDIYNRFAAFVNTSDGIKMQIDKTGTKEQLTKDGIKEINYSITVTFPENSTNYVSSVGQLSKTFTYKVYVDNY